MLRIIPPKAKASYNLYKDFSLFDLLIMTIDILIVLLIFTTVMPFVVKIILGVIILAFGLSLVVNLGTNKKGYDFFKNMLQYFVRRKYNPEVDLQKELNLQFNEQTVLYNNKYSSIVEITGIDFGIIPGDKQDYIIDSIQKSFKNIKQGKIFKLNKPIDLSPFIIETGRKSEYWLNKQLDSSKDDVINQCQSRINILDNVAINLDYFQENKSFIANTFYLIQYDENEERLLENTKALINNFNDNGLNTKQITGEELKAVYTYFYENEEIKIPALKEKHASVIINDEEWKIGSFTNLPFQVGNAWAWKLFSIPNTKVVLNFEIQSDNQKVIKSINKSMREYEARFMEKGLSQSSQLDIEVQYNALQNLLMAVKLGNEEVHNVSLYIMYKKDDYKLVSETFRSEGIILDRLFHNQFESYLAMQPYNYHISKYNKKEIKNFNTSVLTSMFPFVSHPFLDKKGDYLGYSEYPIFFDLFNNLHQKGNKTRVNANMVVLGKSGSGKSYFQKKLLMQQACDNTKIFILDPDNEYDYLANQLSGNWIDLGAVSNNKSRINPFEIFPSLADTEGESGELDATKSFLEQFFNIVAPNLDDEARSTLNKCISKCYDKCKIDSFTDISKIKASQFPTMSTLYDVAKDYIEKIIQIPIVIPSLSSKDIENYLLLLYYQSEYSEIEFNSILSHIKDDKVLIGDFSIEPKYLDDFISKKGYKSSSNAAEFHRITSTICNVRKVVSGSLKGNPRQAKRFLNAFFIKRKLAGFYYDDIDDSVLAKIMALYLIDEEAFKELNKWNLKFTGTIPELEDIESYGKYNEYQKWNKESIKRWIDSEPRNIYKLDLRKYFYLTKEYLTDETIGGYTTEEREILSIISNGDAMVVDSYLKDLHSRNFSMDNIVNTIFDRFKNNKLDISIIVSLFDYFDQYREKIKELIKSTNLSTLKLGSVPSLKRFITIDCDMKTIISNNNTLNAHLRDMVV